MHVKGLDFAVAGGSLYWTQYNSFICVNCLLCSGECLLLLPLSRRHQEGFAESQIFTKLEGFRVMLALVASQLCQNRLAELHGLFKQGTSLSQFFATESIS